MNKNSLGATFYNDNQIDFYVWAPKAKTLSIYIIDSVEHNEYAMTPQGDGYFFFRLPISTSSIDYFYCIDGDKKRPDPASRYQPLGVHGPSRTYNPTLFKWNDSTWTGIPLTNYIIYELHVGTFTPEGTFDALIKKLPYLKELGITAIELMPIVEFPGNRNWGYDGVNLFAPHHAYGKPDDLKRLVNSSHEIDMAVVLDVVYNHLGPEGNYLNDYGYYFTSKYHTDWGEAINYDGSESQEVRRYFIDNALYWLTEFHVDALRLDATHAIFDDSSQHILKEMNILFHDRAKKLNRQSFLFVENDLNETRIINSIKKGGYGIDAQWSDDFHHSIHSVLTNNCHGYLIDFGKIAQIGKALTEGFVIDGQWSEYRKKNHGTSSAKLTGEHFIVCIQNHDQVANTSHGNRLGSLVNIEQYKLASTLLMCCPSLPLLFMGQEWNASTPFLYFTSFEDELLAESVRKGYQEESQKLGNSISGIDPQSSRQFLQSKICWNELEKPDHYAVFQFYKKLISLRKRHPCLSNCRNDLATVEYSEEHKWLKLLRKSPSGKDLLLFANFSKQPLILSTNFPLDHWNLIWNSSDEEMNCASQQQQKELLLKTQPYSALVLDFRHK